MRQILFTFLVTLNAAFAQFTPPSPAIDLVLRSPLRLVGKYISHGSQSGTVQSCIFRNADVTVVYQYCLLRGRPTEAPAVSLRIIPHATGEILRIYAEGTHPATSIRRDSYFDQLWSVSVVSAPAGFSPTMTAAQYREYERAVDRVWGCSVFFMEGTGRIVSCNANVANEVGAPWLAASEPFWIQPSENWYQLQRHMRGLVEAVR